MPAPRLPAEQYLRLYELQQQIADEAATDLVRFHFDPHATWVSAQLISLGPISTKALEYLHLRGKIEYDSTGKLVRFVEDNK